MQIPGISRQPSDAARAVLLDPADTVVLFLDHQTGLFQTVKDVPLPELRANTVALAKIAELAQVPILYTASEPAGTNGPLMEELAAAMPNGKYIPRKGEKTEHAGFAFEVLDAERKRVNRVLFRRHAEV